MCLWLSFGDVFFACAEAPFSFFLCTIRGASGCQYCLFMDLPDDHVTVASCVRTLPIGGVGRAGFCHFSVLWPRAAIVSRTHHLPVFGHAPSTFPNVWCMCRACGSKDPNVLSCGAARPPVRSITCAAVCNACPEGINILLHERGDAASDAAVFVARSLPVTHARFCSRIQCHLYYDRCRICSSCLRYQVLLFVHAAFVVPRLLPYFRLSSLPP